MKGEIFLKPKEARRLPIIEATLAGKLTNQQAAGRLKLSTRQVIRLKIGVKKKGFAALAHQNRGRSPVNATPDEKKQMVCQMALGPYQGANCPQLSELLQEHQQIKLSAKTVGRILQKSGISTPQAKKKIRRFHRRKRKPQEGLLVQMDASPFLWLQDRAPECSLHGAVDDATGKILGLYFRLHEDSIGYFQVLKQMLNRHGVPQCIYSDRHSIFFPLNQKKLSLEEELDGRETTLTHFGRALDWLGIGQIPANSPQAKGRVERLWGTLQHRLVVEMRIAGIKTMDEANAFLPDYIQRYNAQFGRPAQDQKTVFLPPPAKKELERRLCLRYERKVSNGSTFHWRGQNYQLTDRKGKLVYLKPHSKVYILEKIENEVKVEANGEIYNLRRFEEKKDASISLERPFLPQKRTGQRPSLDHPWRKPIITRMKTVLKPIKLPEPIGV
jgi:transposase